MHATKPTPGPWSITRRRVDMQIHAAPGNDPSLHRGQPIAYVCGSGVHAMRQEADARLIAAAPDLLAALEAITSDSGTWNCMPMRLRDLAAAAIAKAEGAQ